jgi:hypothetical protein
MDTVIERCAGLDVHKDTVMACVRVPAPHRPALQHPVQGPSWSATSAGAPSAKMV